MISLCWRGWTQRGTDMTSSTRRHIWLTFLIGAIIAALVASPVAEWVGLPPPAAAAAAGEGWRLVFEDDFNGGALDEGKWTTAFPWGRDRSSVGELQYYAPDAFDLSGGKLKIIADRASGGSHAYNSGLISTHNSFAPEFGRFEIRAKLPRGKGLWPAFWLLPNQQDQEGNYQWPPEVDVFEALGHDTDTVHMTAHWLQNGQHRQDGDEYTGPDFSRDFHTFAVEWTASSITWFVDGARQHEVSQSPRGPMYLLANLAVGGEWPGAPDASTPFPAIFDIDYIRAYEGSPAPEAKDVKAKSKHKHKKRKKHKKKHRR